MFKKQQKIITILLIVFIILMSTFVFADNETDNVASQNIEAQASNESTQNVESQVEEQAQAQVQEDASYKKEDVYLRGDNVTVDYIIDGNLFVMADTVTINSQIGGDAFIIAKHVIVDEKGYIFNNLFVIAESVDIKGVVFDTYGIAKDFTISGGYIYRDLKLVSENLNINGTIGRNAFVSCASISFNTDGDKKGSIVGNLDYKSKSEINFENGLVNGKINYTSSKVSTGKIIGTYIVTLLSLVATVIIIWLICLWIAPKFLSNTNKYVGKATWKVLGIGILAFLAIPLACIVLLALKITACASLVIFALYLVMLEISCSIFVIAVNNYLCSKFKINKKIGVFGMLIVTGIVVGILCELPYAGFVISCIVSILGLGILISSILPKKEGKIAEAKK